jgi:hypothetical protein
MVINSTWYIIDKYLAINMPELSRRVKDREELTIGCDGTFKSASGEFVQVYMYVPTTIYIYIYIYINIYKY